MTFCLCVGRHLLVPFLFHDLTSLHPPSFHGNDFSTCSTHFSLSGKAPTARCEHFSQAHSAKHAHSRLHACALASAHARTHTRARTLLAKCEMNNRACIHVNCNLENNYQVSLQSTFCSLCSSGSNDEGSPWSAVISGWSPQLAPKRDGTFCCPCC